MKKKNIIVIVAIVVVLCICGIIGLFISKSDTEKKKDIILTEIEFPQYMGMISGVQFEDKIDYSAIANEEINNQYFGVERKINNEIINNIISIFKLEDAGKYEYEECDFLRLGKAEMKIYKNGSFRYSNFSINEEEIKFSDEECIEMAEKFLKENKIIDDSYQSEGVGFELYSSMDKPEDEKKISKTVYFKHTFDGIEMYGSVPVYITFNSEGEVTELYALSGMRTEKVEHKSGIEAKDAVERAEKLEGMLSLPEESDKVVLEKIELIYWEDYDIMETNETLQPVYKITGTAYKDGIKAGEFTAYESALY